MNTQVTSIRPKKCDMNGTCSNENNTHRKKIALILNVILILRPN